ncbi:hypothetical protein D3C80_1668650 [compost metagenome]
MTVSALRINHGDAVRQQGQAVQHFLPFLRYNEAGQFNMADMNHIHDPAFDEDTEHRIQGGVPALEEAEA